MKNGVFWDVTPCGSVRTDVSEELSASFIRVTEIGELGTTLAVTSNRRMQRTFFIVTAVKTSSLTRVVAIVERSEPDVHIRSGTQKCPTKAPSHVTVKKKRTL
jgi:hypothetical protein